MGEAGDEDRSEAVEATDGAGHAEGSGTTAPSPGVGPDAGGGEPTDPRATRPQWAPPSDGAFGWRGWVLVGVILVSFLVVPTILVVLANRPSLVGSVGLTFQDAYLALPMIPAILLAVTAVWAALHARR
jgi:hypothetical protein